MYLVTSSEIKEIENTTIEKYGLPAAILMENAGSNAAQAILNDLKSVASKRVCVFCGTGNNGGDGFVVARHLKSEGAHVRIFLAGSKNRMSNETNLNFEIAKTYGLETITIENMDNIKKYNNEISSADVIIDALIGTGLQSKVEGFMANLIVYLNILGKYTVSIDVPSGINCDTGNIPTVAIFANLTVTFGLPKVGLAIYPGLEHVGKLTVADINFPQEILTQPRKNVLITKELAVPMLPYRQSNANKGNFGPVLIIGGSTGMSGAVALAGKACLRSGAGIVTLAVPRGVLETVKCCNDELIAFPLPETETGSLALNASDKILELAGKSKIVILGPGAGRNMETQTLIRKLVKEIKKPLLIDADGLNSVAEDKECLKNISKDVIITPHIGEMARLAGIKIEEVIQDKIAIAKKFAKEYNVVVLLKDGRSLVADPDGNVYVNTTGNSGMATPGSGDVLSGVVGAFMAHGLVSTQAGVVGNYIHGYAGDMLLNEMSEEGITASDLINYMPVAIKTVKK